MSHTTHCTCLIISFAWHMRTHQIPCKQDNEDYLKMKWKQNHDVQLMHAHKQNPNRHENRYQKWKLFALTTPHHTKPYYLARSAWVPPTCVVFTKFLCMCSWSRYKFQIEKYVNFYITIVHPAAQFSFAFFFVSSLLRKHSYTQPNSKRQTTNKCDTISELVAV